MENSLFLVNELMTKQQNASIIRELNIIFESLSMTHQSFESPCLRGILQPDWLLPGKRSFFDSAAFSYYSK